MTISIICGFIPGLLLSPFAGVWADRVNRKTMIIVADASIAAATLFYAPWSSQWQCTKGIAYHKKHELKVAKQYYQAAIHIDPSNHLAQENYKLVQIDQLAILAYDAHLSGEYTTARRYYLKILSIKKNHRWALDNLKELP